MAITQGIAACFRFNNQAEQAVKFYTGIFKNSRIHKVVFNGVSAEQQGNNRNAVAIMFELNGQIFIAENTGVDSPFTDATYLQVMCHDQEELDYFWESLSGGESERQEYGGKLRDQFGVAWQIIPDSLIDMIADENSDTSQRALEAMRGMKKININELKRAYLGKNLH